MAASTPGAAATPVSSASARCRSSTTGAGRRASRISCLTPCAFLVSPTWSRSVPGDMHSLALLKDGTVRAWGENKFGQVGDGTTINRDTPTPVPGCAKRRRHRRARLLLSGRLVRRYGHGLGQHPREQRSSTCTGGGRRRARPSLGRRWRRSCRGAHSNWRGHDLGHFRSLRDRPRRRNASAPGLVKELTDVVSIAASPWASAAVLASGTHHDVVRGAAVAQAGLQRTQQSQSLPDSVVARRTRAALTQFNSQRQRMEVATTVSMSGSCHSLSKKVLDVATTLPVYPTPFHSRGGSKASPTGPTPITILRMVPVNLLSYAL